MYRVRTINLQDADDLQRITATQGKTQACLPKTAPSIHRWIKNSISSFHHKNGGYDGQSIQDKHTEGIYVWGLEYQQANESKVVGCIAVEAMTGGSEPFYSYRRETLINASYRLKVKQEIPVLYQSHELTNYSHIHGFIIDHAHRNQENLCLLLQAVLLYMAEYPDRFSHKLLVEFPGFKDERGFSPLWQDLGQHFFQMDLEQACWHASQEDKALIAQLMPNHPLYETLLSETSRNTLGVPQQNLLDYFDAFSEEGFLASHHVDIFDGGPCLITTMQHSWSIQQSMRLKHGQHIPFSHPHVIANVSSHQPVAILAQSPEEVDRLQLNEGQWLRSVEQLRLNDRLQAY